jgi:hypothetical protein
MEASVRLSDDEELTPMMRTAPGTVLVWLIGFPLRLKTEYCVHALQIASRKAGKFAVLPANWGKDTFNKRAAQTISGSVEVFIDNNLGNTCLCSCIYLTPLASHKVYHD